MFKNTAGEGVRIDMSRRSFLTGVAGVGAIAALGGLAGCAPSQEKADTSNAKADAASGPKTYDKVDKTYDTDLLIVGGGGSGLACAVQAALNKTNFILIEKGSELGGNASFVEGMFAIESKMAEEQGIHVTPSEIIEAELERGQHRQNGALWMDLCTKSAENIEWCLEQGVMYSGVIDEYNGGLYPTFHWFKDGKCKIGYVDPMIKRVDELGIEVDKVNAKQHWIAQCASRANEDLIVKFFNSSEEASNWLLAKAEAVGGSAMVGAFYSHDDVYAEQPGYHMLMIPEEAGLTSTGFAGAELCYNDAVKDGAEFVFDSPAVQLVKDGTKVTGCICEGKDGYVQYNASKGVVLCTGDIGGDLEMCKAYAPICAEYGQPRSQYTPVGVNTGDGHKMGMWVGAQLQDLPLPTMMHPQAFCWFHGPFLFVNDNGERFMCEDTWVQGKSLAINRQPNGEAWSIFDANWKTDLVNGLPYGGGMFWDSFRPYGSDLELAPQYFETQIPEYIKAGNAYQADTLDELAKQIGCDAATFKATVERYNGMCEAGEDTDYYKKPVFLTPVKEGPFYALKVGPALLAVPGGLRTNNDFQCLDAEGAPIEGLYALGNVMGDICAVDYPINVAGNSHGRCITYGYLLGHELAGA